MEKILLLENLKYLVIVSNFICVGGVLSTLVSQNAIAWLIAIELVFISSFLNFISFSLYYLNIEGFIYALIILIFAAIESAMGLAFIAIHFSRNKRLNFDFYKDNTID